MRDIPVFGLVAHALAWLAALYFLLAPVYASVSVEATPPGAPPAEPVRSTATLIEANGLGAGLPILIPVLLTGLPLAARWSFRRRGAPRILLSWSCGGLMLLFCVASLWSVGAFYLPAAIVLLVGAGFDTASRARQPAS